MLLTTSLGSGSFENGKEKNWRKIYIVVVILGGFWTFDRYSTSNAYDYQEVVRVRVFGLSGTEVYSTTDNYFANGQHKGYEEDQKNNHQINQINLIIHSASRPVHLVHLVIKTKQFRVIRVIG